MIEIHGDVVIKRFRSWDRGQPQREWSALTLLAEHAPGLAPTPIEADLMGDPPVVVMSRLEGVPLTAGAQAEQILAMAGAVATIQAAIPRQVLVDLPPRPGHPGEFLDGVRIACARRPDLGVVPSVARAFDAAVEWLNQPKLDDLANAEQEPVLGTGDGNLSNYLWDGERVQIIDFEYSGRSDRAFELAEITEHISAWADGSVDTSPVLSRFEPTAAEVVRLREWRRLMAVYWLLALRPGVPAEHVIHSGPSNSRRSGCWPCWIDPEPEMGREACSSSREMSPPAVGAGRRRGLPEEGSREEAVTASACSPTAFSSRVSTTAASASHPPRLPQLPCVRGKTSEASWIALHPISRGPQAACRGTSGSVAAASYESCQRWVYG